MDIAFCSLIIILLHLITLVLLKLNNFKSRLKSKALGNCCPKCYQALSRIRRKAIDYFINGATLNIFSFKRFKCNSCSWEGILSKFTVKINN